MKLIRLNSFETNSSSAHSIVLVDCADGMVNVEGMLGYNPAFLTDRELMERSEWLEDGPETPIGEGEYGWGYESYTDTKSMADYCLLQLLPRPSSYDVSGRKEILLKPKERIAMIFNLIMGGRLYKGGEAWGGLDHQSDGIVSNLNEAATVLLYGKRLIIDCYGGDEWVEAEEDCNTLRKLQDEEWKKQHEANKK
jgi:hypothetical protein